MLALERDRRTMGVDVFQLAMPPDVASFFDVNFVPGPSENDHPPDRRFSLERFINVVLEGNDRPAPKAAITATDLSVAPDTKADIATAVASQSAMRSRMLSALKPPKTTE